jgi:hypothetical protein
MRTFQTRLGHLPIYFIYIPMFALASFGKLTQSQVPLWFHDQFKATILASTPGMLTFSFYMIGILEAVACAGFLASLARLEFVENKPKTYLKASLLFSAFVFGALSFGLRLSNDFNTASQVFIYFAVSFILYRLLARDEIILSS